jgi:hypothetical protein
VSLSPLDSTDNLNTDLGSQRNNFKLIIAIFEGGCSEGEQSIFDIGCFGDIIFLAVVGERVKEEDILDRERTIDWDDHLFAWESVDYTGVVEALSGAVDGPAADDGMEEVVYGPDCGEFAEGDGAG